MQIELNFSILNITLQQNFSGEYIQKTSICLGKFIHIYIM